MQVPWPEPTSYRQLLAQRSQAFEERIRAGDIRPVVYPFDFLGLYILLFALCTPLPLALDGASGSRGSSWRRTVTRGAITAGVTILFLNSLFGARCTVLANGYINGLTTVWGIVWLFTCFVFHDAQSEFRRIVRITTSRGDNANNAQQVQAGQRDAPTSGRMAGNGTRELRRRKHQISSEKRISEGSDDVICGEWEPFPQTGTLNQRYFWANDLLANFRGLGWNWKPVGLPPVPIRKEWELGTASSGDVLLTKEEERVFKRRRIWRSFWQFWLCYFLIDILKVAMVADQYFWGLVDSPPPPHLPSFIRDSVLLTRTYRLLFTMSGAFLALRFVFAGVQYSFLVSLNFLGAEHLSEAWLNVPYNGSLVAILNKGLAGFWGQWWHQLFRFGFVSAGQFICRLLFGQGASMKSQKAILVQSFTAFFISGCFHAAGSFTMDAPTIPWHPFAFFILQFIGIILQRSLSKLLIALSIRDRFPLVLRRAGNVVFTLSWLWLTGPLFADDAAKGGIWLFEPIPVSPVRGLGFGTSGEGWFPVRGTFFAWHSDNQHWWLSGIRVY